MIISFFIGVLLGLYVIKAVGYSNKYKNTKYASYVRFAIVVSVSILGPAAVYLLRVLYGEGQEGDTPLIYTAIFGASALVTIFGYSYYLSKNLNHGK